MQELEQQLVLVKKNRTERIESTNEKLADIQDRKKKIKDDMDIQLKEHHSCLKQVISDLAEVQQCGDQEEEYNALISDFMAVSGGVGDEYLFEQQGLDD